ncbi:hypothetical protein COY90_05430 [Candidatus Roizmanbacteria bacterium CG_4_10_14_0_8_um_filter_39_9]|uniref:Glycosyltransferase RgtA/B/C/D-like domain-containing protein n=1 Tax=Candidatus Roizmanbacteria bacterium CG_4_10_14_0_8_um_filter_39_9 TaxID=1974829 RepID=A0A2M7QBF2_9BACT|nr:MAG: hypothetical protein COY90_05430 [Candidatus Roizmanbacteria bacterium CG_4_10_14_0_8_um_filter_39_9]
MKNLKPILAIIILIISVSYLSMVVVQHLPLYTSKYSAQKTKQLYDESQWSQSQNVSPMKILDAWALKNKYTGWNNFVDENKEKKDIEKVKKEIIDSVRAKGVSDATLYTYVGHEYMRGTDPTLLNPEHPPLGKYLIGISIRVFQNEHVILLIFGFITLITIFFIVSSSTKSYLPASVAILLTTTHSLFIDQLIHGPQLELFQLTFFLLMVLFLMLFEERKNVLHLIFSAVFFGCFLSVKTFSTHFLLIIAWLTTLIFFSKKFKLKEWIVLNAGAVVIFISTYAVFFLKGGSLRQWLGVQKYIVMFYKQAGINVFEFAGNYLRLIFTGSWKFWTDNSPVSHYGEWSIMWSIVFIFTIMVIIMMLKQKDKKNVSFLEWMLISFIGIYNLYLFIIPMFPRYLLLLFIPMIVLISIRFNTSIIFYEKSKK